jgi:hypothetical protein
MRASRPACLVGWLLCGVGCGVAVPREQLSVERVAIVNGEASVPGGSEDAVLLLRTMVDGAELLCSASLVAKNLVLTARHCVAHLVQGPFNCTVQGELIDNPTGAGRLGAHLPAAGVEFYGGSTPRSAPLAHGTQVISTLSQTICLNDIAFVVLDTPLDLPVLPFRLGASARKGELTTLVGYGSEDTMGAFIDFRTQERRRKSGLSIAGVGPDSVDDGVTTVPPRTIVLEGPSGCVGDSGGPLLAEKTMAVLGVYSLLDGKDCTDPAVRHELVHVPVFRVLIEEAFRAAGAEPTLEPRPSPSNEPCGDASAEAGNAASCTPLSAASGTDVRPPAIERASSSSGGCAVQRRGPRERSNAILGLLLLALGQRIFRRGARKTPSRLECRGSQRRPSSGSLPAGAGARGGGGAV